jgi:hypothetical protein
MFSYFNVRENNKPDGSLNIDELHRLLVNPDREPFAKTVNIIQRLRAESDKKIQDKIKAELPVFTPGALLDTKAAETTPEQKNIRYSGFMQIDIDLKDNPNMTDPEAIRDKLAQIPYIALSAISARGRGVWGLMALQQPEKFMQYIDQVYNYFKRARVTIDNTKSKNPTELRYFAPDSGAILNPKYDLLPLEQVPAKPKPQTKQATSNKASGSTLADLQKWVTDTTPYSLTDGQKHHYIFWLSYAIRKNGASEENIYKTIYENVLSQDQITTNCIPGGIAHANNKGNFTTPPPQSTPQPKQMQPKRVEMPVEPIAEVMAAPDYYNIPIRPATGKLKELESLFISIAKKRKQSTSTNEDIIRLFDRYKRLPPGSDQMNELERMINLN